MAYAERTRRIYTGVTPEQEAEIKAAASIEGVTASAWVYEAVKTKLKRAIKKSDKRRGYV